MEKIIEKISQYHLLNALLPGVFFVYLSERFAGINLLTNEIIFNFFVIYMYGWICSRIGSLVVEPILKKVKFVQFAKYKDYLNASQTDPKLAELNTDNNFYRTMIGVSLSETFLLAFKHLMNHFTFVNDHFSWILIGLCFLLFLFSYRKQTRYIKKHIENELKKTPQNTCNR